MEEELVGDDVAKSEISNAMVAYAKSSNDIKIRVRVCLASRLLIENVERILFGPASLKFSISKLRV